MSHLLSNIVVKNFKPIGNEGIELELKPLTIFVGPNGSGKSSALEALALLSQNVGKEFEFHGDLIKYPSRESVSFKKDTTKPMLFSIKIRLTQDEISRLYNGNACCENQC